MRDIYAMKGMAHLRLTSAAIAKMRWIYISHRIRLTTYGSLLVTWYKNIFPQEIFFSARNIFLRKKYIFLRKKNISCGKKYFLRKNIFLAEKNLFSCGKIYFLRRKIYFFAEKYVSCGEKYISCGEKYFLRKKIFLAEKYFCTMLPISFRNTPCEICKNAIFGWYDHLDCNS